MTELSIILVNWNCLDFTEQCIASICSTVDQVNYEVIVVDNASEDAPCQSLVEKYPWVKLVLSEQNIGFGRANNLGAQHSSGRDLFFLNPDTVLLRDSVRRMLIGLNATSQAGAVGCRLLNPDGSLQTSSVQRFPTILNQLLALKGLQRLLPSLPLWGKQALYSTKVKTIHEVDVVSGAGLMVRRKVFESIGGFNPEYFMFAEEVDLCYAIRHAGWKVVHCRDAEITHFGGQSTKSREDGFADIAMRDSVFRFLQRTRGSFYARLYRFSLLLNASCHLFLLVLLLPFSYAVNIPISRARIGRIWRKWVRIGWWGLGAWQGTNKSIHLSATPTSIVDN